MTDSDQSNWDQRRHLIVLFLILGAAILLRLYEFRGFGASDDAAYAEIAGRIARGEAVIGAYDGPAVVPLRVGIIAPTAFLFWLFGVSSWTQVGFIFIASLIGVLLAYVAARHFFGPTAGLAAAGIWAILPIDAFHASILAPDPPAAVALGAAILLSIWLLDTGGSARRYLGGGIAAGVMLGYSWLCKETLAYAAPFFVFLIIYNWKRLGEIWGLWVGIAVGSVGVLFAEAFTYFQATGDWLHHLSETQRVYEQYPNSFSVERPGDSGGYVRAVIRRVVYTGPWTILINPRLGYLPLLGGVAMFHAWFRGDRRFFIPAVWFMSLVLMFNFASSSLTEYVPLLLFDRYLYPIFLPATILLAGFLAWPFEDWDQTPQEQRRERAFWSVAGATVILLVGVWQGREYRSFGEDRLGEVYAVAQNVDPGARVYSDAHSIMGLDFEWDYPAEFDAVNFEGMETAAPIQAGSYVLVNQRYLAHLLNFSGWWPTETNPYERPPFADDPPPNWEVEWSGEYVTLYAVR